MDWSSPLGIAGAVAFINAAWQGLALVFQVWIATRVSGLRNASTLSAVWLVTFALLAALPAIDTAIGRTAEAPPAPTGSALGPQRFVALALHAPGVFLVRAGSDAGRVAQRFAPQRLAPLVALSWALVAGILLLRLGRGYAELFRLKREAVPAPDLRALVPLADRRDTRVAVSTEIGTACAAGFLRPMILLPEADVRGLGRDDLARIVAHEYGHLARYDDWTNAAMQAVCALFFFLPALSIAARQVELARERACDDVAIRRTGDRTAYARMLTAVVERAVYARRMATAPGFGASDVFGRVNHALDDHLDRRGGVNAGGVLFVVAVIAAAVGMARLGIPRLAHAGATPRPVVIIADDSSGGGLLSALAAAGYGRVDPDDLVQLANHGVTARDIIVLPNHDRSIDDLIEMHDHGVTADLVRAVTQAFPSATAGDIIDFANQGVSASDVLQYVAADSSLSSSDIVDLHNAGVDPDFIGRLAAHGYRHLGVDKLEELRNSGFTP
jgi:beta-lactamase regulating signal transducer with metallopeptidase domain